MKNHSLIIISVFALALSLPSVRDASALYQSPSQPKSKVRIQLDFESAQAVIDLFDKKQAPDDELERIAKLPGNQTLIRVASQAIPPATEDNFKLSLKQKVETESSGKDNFQWGYVKSRLPQIKALMKEVEKNPQALIEEVAARIREYIPKDLEVEASVFFILGGPSNAFTLPNGEFYVGLHDVEDGYEGLKLTMSHELFHVAQEAARKQFPQPTAAGQTPANISRCLTLLSRTMNEGTASMVGDPLKVQTGKKDVEWLKKSYQTNLRRIEDNYALFETLLFRLYNDPDVTTNRLNSVGFSDTWDRPLYFVGYRMGKVIEKYEGKDAIATSIGKSPLYFFNKYIETYRTHSDPEAVRFSKTCEEIIQKLQEREIR